MIVLEYILLSLLLICAIVIVVVVTLQKSNEGLSGTIAGGSETYYGKDKGNAKGKLLFKISLIACIVFAVAVLAVYVLQPDYANIQNNWNSISKYSSIFTSSN
jgi:preprotein translocase subunit SecG